MITPDYVQTMARYNRCMNEKMYAAGARLTDQERKADRGAFFKSIHSMFNHLLWGDYMWLGRFTQDTALARDYPTVPLGADLYENWDELKAARIIMDDDIDAWTASVKRKWLESDFTWYSGLTRSTRTKPGWVLVTHMFNHQIHHRGQVSLLLMQQGIDTGSTDLPLMPEEPGEFRY